MLGTETVFSAGADTGRLVIVARPGVMIALRDHPEGAGESFDPVHVGLDHLAFQVPSQAELESRHRSLEAQGVTCSTIEASRFGLHLNLEDPDKIAIELFVSQPS